VAGALLVDITVTFIYILYASNAYICISVLEQWRSYQRGSGTAHGL
jgi:hypothetical protein